MVAWFESTCLALGLWQERSSAVSRNDFACNRVEQELCGSSVHSHAYRGSATVAPAHCWCRSSGFTNITIAGVGKLADALSSTAEQLVARVESTAVEPMRRALGASSLTDRLSHREAIVRPCARR